MAGAAKGLRGWLERRRERRRRERERTGDTPEKGRERPQTGGLQDPRDRTGTGGPVTGGFGGS